MKPEGAPRFESPKEASPDLATLTRTQREALAKHLTDIDNVDAAFADYKRSIKEAHEATASGDEVWSKAAKGDANRAEERWKNAKTATRALPEILHGVIDDGDLGRKQTREQLRKALAESQARFETKEAITVETAAKDSEPSEEVEATESIAKTSEQADVRAEIEQEETRFVQEANEATQAIRAAHQQLDDATNEAYVRFIGIQETLGKIRLPDAVAVSDDVEQCRMRLVYAMSGIEESSALLQQLTNGGEASFGDVSRSLPRAIEEIREARQRLDSVKQLIEEVIPHLARMDNLLEEYAGNFDHELLANARIMQESLEEAGLAFSHHADSLEELMDRARQIEEKKTTLPEKDPDAKQQENERERALQQDMHETAQIIMDGTAEARKHYQDTTRLSAHLNDIMRMIRIPGLIQISPAIEKWQNNIRSIEEGLQHIDDRMKKTLLNESLTVEQRVRQLQTLTTELSRVDATATTNAGHANGITDRLVRLSGQLNGMRGIDSNEIHRLAIAARQSQERALHAMRSRISRWHSLLKHTREIPAAA